MHRRLLVPRIILGSIGILTLITTLLVLLSSTSTGIIQTVIGVLLGSLMLYAAITNRIGVPTRSRNPDLPPTFPS